MDNRRIVWITGSWAYDTDKDLVPFLMQKKNLNIDWWVLTDSKAKTQLPDFGLFKTYNITHRGSDLRRVLDYKKLFRKCEIRNAQLIYSNELGMPFYYPTLFHHVGNKIPIVHAAHNVIPYPVWPWFMKIYVIYIFRKNQYFHLFSKFTAVYFNSHYPNKSMYYSPMTLKGYGRSVTNKYTIDKTKLNLLFFGNVVGNKRLDLLITAIKELPADIQAKVHLNICGNCKNKEFFLQQIDGCDTITAYFHRIPDEEIPELFTKHQFLMLPYEDVAQSGPHMIAYYYNLPVIASDIDGFKERVDDGINGILFKSGDVKDLKAKIIQAVSMTENERKEMKSSLKSYAESNFSIEAVSEKYIDYFNTITK